MRERSLRLVMTLAVTLGLQLGAAVSLQAQPTLPPAQDPTPSSTQPTGVFDPAVRDSLMNRKEQQEANRPPSFGIPGNRASAGSRRDICAARGMGEEPQPLQALMPTNGVGATASTTPSLFFFVPETEATHLDFVLSDTQHQIIYSQSFLLTESPGIVQVVLPRVPGSLAQDTWYRWGLELVCDLHDSAKNPTVVGYLQRIPDGDTPEDRLSLAFALQEGLWVDSVTSLAAQIRQRPQDPIARADWRTFLQLEALDAVVDQPLLPCCKQPLILSTPN